MIIDLRKVVFVRFHRHAYGIKCFCETLFIMFYLPSPNPHTPHRFTATCGGSPQTIGAGAGPLGSPLGAAPRLPLRRRTMRPYGTWYMDYKTGYMGYSTSYIEYRTWYMDHRTLYMDNRTRHMDHRTLVYGP